MNMTPVLIEDARVVLRHAWSVRLALLSALFSGLQLALPYLDGMVSRPTMVVLAMTSGIGAAASGLGAAAARFVKQPRMRRKAQEVRNG